MKRREELEQKRVAMEAEMNRKREAQKYLHLCFTAFIIDRSAWFLFFNFVKKLKTVGVYYLQVLNTENR